MLLISSTVLTAPYHEAIAALEIYNNRSMNVLITRSALKVDSIYPPQASTIGATLNEGPHPTLSGFIEGFEPWWDCCLWRGGDVVVVMWWW
jgi:hypothetical protein